MRKAKLLMPLTGIAALGAIAPVIATTTSCSKVSLTKITAEDNGDKHYIGVDIKKSEITVTATYSNGTTKEVTDWTCADFQEEIYTPSIEWEHTFTIIYAENGVEKSTTLTINFDAQTTIDFGFKNYVLTTGTVSGQQIQVSKKLAIFGGLTGQIIDPAYFTFNSSLPTVATIDDQGVVTTVGTGTTDITAVWKDQSNGLDPLTCTVKVVSQTLDNLLTLDDTNNTAKILADDTWCGDDFSFTVPREIKTNAGKTYKVTELGATSTSIGKVRILTLPNTIVKIDENAFYGGNLFKICYNGTAEQWKSVAKGRNWYGDKAIGVQCLDELVLFNNCRDTELHEEVEATDGEYLVTQKSIGDLTHQNYLIRFDYSEFGFDTDAEARAVTIQAYKESELWGTSCREITINHVYINGIEATKDVDWSYSTASGADQYKLIFKASTAPESKAQLTKDSIVTLDVSTSILTSNYHVCAAKLK